MNYQQACQILDRHKEGNFYPLRIVNCALQLTGDLPETSGANDCPIKKSGVESLGLASCPSCG